MKLPTTISAVISALLLVGALGVVSMLTPRTSGDTLGDQVIISYEPTRTEEGERSISYEYLGELVAGKIVKDEVLEKRTENSYTRYLGTENKGTKQERDTFQVTIYEQPVYVKQGGKWYFREEATTTEAAFYKGFHKGALAYLLTPIASAASYSGFGTAGDGYEDVSTNGDFDSGNSVTFANCETATDANGFIVGSSLDTTSTLALITAQYRSNGLGNCTIDRGYLEFNTASVPAGSTISAASVQIYVTTKVNSVNDGQDYITITKPGGSWTTWDTTGASSAPDITSITTSAYTTFTLNSTGWGYVTKGGTTTFGIQEGHDVAGSMITSTTQGNSVTYSTSEETGTAQDPILNITYTAPAGGAFWQFQDY